MKIKKASNKRAQHTAIVSAREGKSIAIDREVLIERKALEVFFILVFNQKDNEVLHAWVEIRDIMLRTISYPNDAWKRILTLRALAQTRPKV